MPSIAKRLRKRDWIRCLDSILPPSSICARSAAWAVSAYDYAIMLRATDTSDFMTAENAKLSWSVFGKVASRIVNEVKGVESGAV